MVYMSKFKIGDEVKDIRPKYAGDWGIIIEDHYKTWPIIKWLNPSRKNQVSAESIKFLEFTDKLKNEREIKRLLGVKE